MRGWLFALALSLIGPAAVAQTQEPDLCGPDGFDPIACAAQIKAAQSEPDALPQLYNERALALEARGQHAAAVADLRATLRLQPDEPIALGELAQIGSPPVTPPSTDVATLSGRIVGARQDLYDTMKIAFVPMFQPPRRRDGLMTLDNCRRGSDFVGDANPVAGDPVASVRFAADADLAYNVVQWRRDLAAWGYPPKVWSTLVDRFETEQLAHIDGLTSAVAKPDDGDAADAETERYDTFVQTLVTAADAYRNAHPSARLPRVAGALGCGADTPTVNVRTQPAGAVVMFIPMFFYKLCQAQGMNPEDTVHCDRWREMIEGAVAAVQGDYAYLARWPDGAVRRGRLSLGQFETGQTITLAKP
jgi:hypothetical protein